MLCSELLSSVPGLFHAFGTAFEAPPPAVTLRQIHSATVWNAAGLADRAEEGDALVANQPDVLVGVRTADCVPILLADPATSAFAAIHAGWRGTAAQIVRAVLARMTADFGTDPASVLAAIGPAIAPCCYETSPEIARQFQGWNAVVGTRHLDLASANFIQLQAAGLAPTHIEKLDICTRCDTRFHSYRRDSLDPGRQLSVIGFPR